jgi:hypothetical protein
MSTEDVDWEEAETLAAPKGLSVRIYVVLNVSD